METTKQYNAVGISLGLNSSVVRSGWQTASYGTSWRMPLLRLEIFLVDLVDLAVPWVMGFEFLAIPWTSNSGLKLPYCFLSGSESWASNSWLFPELQTQAWSLFDSTQHWMLENNHVLDYPDTSPSFLRVSTPTQVFWVSQTPPMLLPRSHHAIAYWRHVFLTGNQPEACHSLST